MTADPIDLLTAESFEALVEQLVYDSDDQITYLDAVIEICNRRDLEVEAVAGILTASLKARLESDFMDTHFLKRKAQLPMDW